ncbi:FHA domain-containing protein [Corallococcus sp. BB11-1]|nr:FHA domain-containing protein [Corallococcus sp. BB11-1]
MTQGLQVGRELAFEQAEVKIGRTSENDLVLHDHGVSRRHARITTRDGRYFAEDVGSANGTQLNGQPLGGQKQLCDGDRITVGPVEFTFVWVPQDEEADVTRPIRRVLAPPHAQVSPQGLEQASLAAIEAAPTSFQQSIPAMTPPSFLPTPRSDAGARSMATTAVPLVPMPARKPEALAPSPKQSSAPDVPAVGAPAPGRSSAPGLPSVGVSTPNKVAPAAGATPAQGRASGPGLPSVGASAPDKAGPPGPPVLDAAAPKKAEPRLPAGAPALNRPALGRGAAAAKSPALQPSPDAPSIPAGAPAPRKDAPPLAPAASGKAPAPRSAVASVPLLPSVPALTAPVASTSARGAPASVPLLPSVPPLTAPVAHPSARGAVASVPLLPSVPALTTPSAERGAPAPVAPGLPVLSPPGLMPPPPPVATAAASWAAPPPGLPLVDLDEPEERTLMAISTVASPEPIASPPPVASFDLAFPDPDEPEERTLMAISTVASPEPFAPPPPVASADLAFLDPDEPEERTLMAISTVASPEPFAPPPPVASAELAFPDPDEPEERTLMAIPAVQAPPEPPPGNAPPPEVVAAAAPPPLVQEEEVEERTVLDLRPITQVNPLVPRPVLHVAPAAKPAVPVTPAVSEEPATYVGKDQALPPSPPDEPSETKTFIGQDGPVPPPPPMPDPVTFVGKERRDVAAPPAMLAGASPSGGADLLALLSPEENDSTQSLPPSDSEASSVQPARSVTVVAKVEPSTAADRARRRRQLARTLGGQVILAWNRQSRLRRVGFVSLACVVVLATLFGVVSLVSRSSLGLPGREPFKLGLETVPDSFGLGQGVRWIHADDKVFDFRFVSPTRAVAVLHYQASNISKDEVNLSLNGVSLGWVPPDTAQTQERELEQVMPPGLLRRNENNQVLFDNALNPPGQESWRIWNLRLEIIPVPELPPDQLLASAREAVTAGARFYELKDVGGENLFRAWQQYRSAWITLEALDEKPDLYGEVRERIAQISTELDHRCGKLMLEFQQAVQFRSRRQAVAALAEVRRRFPSTEHRCHNLAVEKAYEHEL